MLECTDNPDTQREVLFSDFSWKELFFDLLDNVSTGNIGIGLLSDILLVRALPTFASLVLSVPMVSNNSLLAGGVCCCYASIIL